MAGWFNLINQTDYSFSVIDKTPYYPIPTGFSSGNYPSTIGATQKFGFMQMGLDPRLGTRQMEPTPGR
ncbi:hypothetical protein TWF696_003893 [Orbilia brochopaga]|uniref:Uncharacterized protein n=1 Tax=Orbilia brochopaga TaxID=3140254 RepID=A0AAV9V4L0_9PEZI